MPVKKISSDEVELGMFIDKLDRPWSETPFLFQGFELRKQEEIDELRRLSKHVYIMVPDEEIELTKVSSGNQASTADSGKLHKIKYKVSVSAGTEIKAARQAHEDISQIVTEIESLVRAESQLQIEDIQEPVKVMVGSITNNPDAYLWLTRIKKFDSFVYKDSLSCAVWATALGIQLGMEESDLQTLATGCMLMDVGKLSLPVELLQKQQRLSRDEWELIKTHVQRGVSILEADPDCSSDIIEIVRTHHERLDGSGFPNALRANQISLFGQIAGIVDFYVAVTTPRPFARVISPSLAEQMLFEQKDKYFDELLVEYFIRTLGTYPTGSLVELSTGEVALVMAQNPTLILKPDVVLLLDPDKKPYDVYSIARLVNYSDHGKPVLIVKSLKDGDYGLDIEELSL